MTYDPKAHAYERLSTMVDAACNAIADAIGGKGPSGRQSTHRVRAAELVLDIVFERQAASGKRAPALDVGELAAARAKLQAKLKEG